MKTAPKSRKGDPLWEIAELYTAQGHWSEEEYLELDTNRLVEFDNGLIEFQPWPTMSHQLILGLLSIAIAGFVEPRERGLALFGIRVRLWTGKFRQPDIVFMLAKNADRMGEAYWTGADGGRQRQ